MANRRRRRKKTILPPKEQFTFCSKNKESQNSYLYLSTLLIEINPQWQSQSDPNLSERPEQSSVERLGRYVLDLSVPRIDCNCLWTPSNECTCDFQRVASRRVVSYHVMSLKWKLFSFRNFIKRKWQKYKRSSSRQWKSNR